MSYCRFSTNNFRCMLYVYADVGGGWTIHVAGNKVVGDIPDDGWKQMTVDKNYDAYIKRHQAQMEFLRTAERKQVDLPFAGEGFYNLPKDETVRTLEMLKDLGYIFPYEIIEEIEGEEENNAL